MIYSWMNKVGKSSVYNEPCFFDSYACMLAYWLIYLFNCMVPPVCLCSWIQKAKSHVLNAENAQIGIRLPTHTCSESHLSLVSCVVDVILRQTWPWVASIKAALKFHLKQWLDWYKWYNIVGQYNTEPRLIVISQATRQERILKLFSSG